jgi:hypothetical protein
MKIMRFIRIALWCLLIFLVFALIWWGGPALRLGDSRPLEPVGWRLGLIALILLIFAIPLLLRALSYLYEKLKTVESDPVVDDILVACRSLRAQIKRQAVRRWGGPFAVDYLLTVPQEALDELLSKWPAVVAWRLSHEGAGTAFMSEGRIYLVPEPSAWAHWARLLRWRMPPRGLLALLPAHLFEDRMQLQASMDALYGQGAQWRTLAGRVLPIWLVVLGEPRAHAGYDWHAEQSNAPWGITLPRGRFSRAGFEHLCDQALRVFDITLTEPSTPSLQVQRWMQLRAACTVQLRNATQVLARQTDRSLEARLAVRGLHFVWSGPAQAHGLPGWLTVLARDRGRAALCLEWRLAQAAVLSMVSLAAAALVLDATWMRTVRHERVLSDWSVRLPQLPLLGLLAQPSGVSVSDWRLALNDVDQLMADSAQRLGEAVPESGQRLVQRLHTAGVHRGLITQLHLDAQRAFEASAIADERYRYLAFSMMLHEPQRANPLLMASVLADLSLTPSQATTVVGHWGRASVRQPTAAEQTQMIAQRTRLRDRDRYSHESVLWSAMQEQLRPLEALDFSLERYMGPNAGWFLQTADVPWFFTYEGLIRGFLSGRDRYEYWTREYRWIMGEPDAVFSIDAQEAMEVRLRTLYVQQATEAWRQWLEGLRLQPVSGLPDAADRAQLFGTDASPVVPLLDVLEVHMPLPQTGKRSFWDRVKIRVAEDWARLQFALGWRRSPKASMNRSDPRIAIGQNFALLQMYFLDAGGKSPKRDQYLSALNSISDYLGRLNASDQMGSKVPPAGVLVKLRAKALRTPSPLRELILELANSSEEQVKLAGAQTLGLMLEDVASHARCQRMPVHPMDIDTAAELPWMEFVSDFGAHGKVPEIWQAFSRDPAFLKSMADPSSQKAGAALTDAQWLERAMQLSQAWFPKSGQGLSLRLRPVALSPQLRAVRMAIGSTQWSYAHGQSLETRIDWSPDIGLPKVDMELETVDGQVSRLSFTGAWALLRWASQAQQPTVADRSKVLLHFDGPQGFIQLLVTADTARNPLDVSLYDGLCKAGQTKPRQRELRVSAADLRAPGVPPASLQRQPIPPQPPGTTGAPVLAAEAGSAAVVAVPSVTRMDLSLSADSRSRLSTSAVPLMKKVSAMKLQESAFNAGPLKVKLPPLGQNQAYLIQLTEDPQGKRVMWQQLSDEANLQIPAPDALPKDGLYFLAWQYNKTSP